MLIYNVGTDSLGEWDLSYLDQTKFEWLIYRYVNDYYEGHGEAVALRKEDGKLCYRDLSHCSCYGPIEDYGNPVVFTVEEFLAPKTSIHDVDAGDELKSKVRELLGV